MELWVNEFWLLCTAVIFTFVGWYFGIKSGGLVTAEIVIDSLIEQGYLKTRGEGKQLEILKHTEWSENEH